jgi:hypothetical protein
LGDRFNWGRERPKVGSLIGVILQHWTGKTAIASW